MLSSPLPFSWQPGVPGPQGNANPIGQPQGVANKIVAWTGVLEWQEVKLSKKSLTLKWCRVVGALN